MFYGDTMMDQFREIKNVKSCAYTGREEISNCDKDWQQNF